jgi:hypothetical protein
MFIDMDFSRIGLEICDKRWYGWAYKKYTLEVSIFYGVRK